MLEHTKVIETISPEISETLDLHSMLDYAKVTWLTRHPSCDNRCTALTYYIKVIWLISIPPEQSEALCLPTSKGHLTDQNTSPEKPKTLHSHTILDHIKVKTIDWSVSLLSNQKPCTDQLYWIMQKLFDQSKHLFWEIKNTALTCYVKTCKGHLINQNIPSEESEAMHSHTTLDYAKVISLISILPE